MPGLAGQNPDYRGVKIVTGANVRLKSSPLPLGHCTDYLIGVTIRKVYGHRT
ncbi:hypothetical protein AK36_5668 [Burkholderia vietnamiensis LMG 10929]|nr:hypothetical protein AK36_5668 [Burkholderia vietnamiensis LMG 10929]